MLCVIGTFLNAPFTHMHIGDDHDSVVHSHFTLHIGEFDSHDGAAIHAKHHDEAHYIEFLNAPNESVKDRRSFALTQAATLQPTMSVLDATLTSEARAHGPPTLNQIPARSPPTDLLSFMA